MVKRFTFREILLITSVLAFCSLVYEMAIAACFVMMTGDAVFWMSVTIGIYLASIGAGTFYCSRLKTKDPWLLLFKVELSLVAAGALSVPGILAIETTYRIYHRFYADFDTVLPYIGTLALCHGFTVLVGFLSGFEIPLMLRLGKAADGKEVDRFNMVLGVNYFGALAGSLAFSLVLLPRLDILYTVLVAAVLNLGVCTLIYFRGAVIQRVTRWAWIGASAGLLLMLSFVVQPIYRFYVLNYYSGYLGVPREMAEELENEDDDGDEDEHDENKTPSFASVMSKLLALNHSVERVRTNYQYIDKVTTEWEPSDILIHFNEKLAQNTGVPMDLTLFLNRRFQFAGATEVIYHEHMAHVPIQAFGRVPKNILILGGGDGLLARELLKYEQVVSITNVELDPAMIELARNDRRIRAMNESSFHDPRVTIINADAFFFVRNERRRYDAIYIDFPYPYSYNLARLYSVEFFKNVARLLTPGGVATMDFPLVDGGEDELTEQAYRSNTIIMNTLEAAGYQTILPFNTESRDVIPFEEAVELDFDREDETDPVVDRLLRTAKVVQFARENPDLEIPDDEDLMLVGNLLWYESMVSFSPQKVELDFEFKDEGIELFNLTPRRLRVIENLEFPFRRDPEMVNSIFKPMLFKPFHLRHFAFQ